MNKLTLSGRLTKDPEVRYSKSRNGDDMAVARFNIAVDRRFAKNTDETTADFFTCTAFGKTAEFIEKYMKKGTKILLHGRIENDNYTNKEGQKVYGVRVMVEEIEFAESKRNDEPKQSDEPKQADDFIDVPDGIENDLPFK